MILSVIGLGKLGKPISEELGKKHQVIGIDINDEIPMTDLAFICVPTPSQEDDKFSSDIVENVLDKIKERQIVAIISTLMPGETDRLQNKYPHLTLLYNPSFVALGSVAHNFTHPDFVLIGSENKDAIEILKSVYRTIIDNPKFAVLTPLEAEITKLALNCYITTKITFANQIGNLCYRLGIKPDRILGTIGQDRRVGNRYFKSGLGYGGTCFPRDNLALSAYCWDKRLTPLLFRSVHYLNEGQIDEMVRRIEALNPNVVGFKSLSFKEGTDVTECSQLKMIYERLKQKGYTVIIGKGDVNLDWGGIC